jgi:hypothetical protein
MMRIIAAVLALSSQGCGLIGPSCLARQNRGSVTTLTGVVEPGQIVMHRVSYATEGSQNDAQISWGDQYAANGPRLKVYATKVECADFAPPPTASCSILASAGSGDLGIATTLIVTHGRGNPEILGSPPEYKLWVVGDPGRSVRYTISVSYFYGPDC